ncbi:hypothetical protein EKG38_01300 [Shewanella canadensis]|uniref:Uncharacterized protein n=2 Tax=Shewanella canadensis TaxID=271096 RepID=A0A431X036_9GAMM|nr:hypothetical protein EKG38_01300 [Shewanella canadensis]
MSDQFICWHCGKVLEEIILPMSRREECEACGADQHVCKMCVFFNDSGRGDCKEERAEWISDRERANFCDYFKPSAKGAASDVPDANEQALAEFAELFGDTSSTGAEDKDKDREKTPAEIAEQQLRDLLGE